MGQSYRISGLKQNSQSWFCRPVEFFATGSCVESFIGSFSPLFTLSNRFSSGFHTLGMFICYLKSARWETLLHKHVIRSVNLENRHRSRKRYILIWAMCPGSPVDEFSSDRLRVKWVAGKCLHWLVTDDRKQTRPNEGCELQEQLNLDNGSSKKFITVEFAHVGDDECI